MKQLLYSVLILLSLWSPSISEAQDQGYYDDFEIRVLTAAQGDEIYSNFGHTAIRVSSEAMEVDRVYNYGLFNFDAPNFYTNFLRGKLNYGIGTSSYVGFLNEYYQNKRTVWEQKLNLSPQEKSAFLEYLDINMLPENRYYMYDFLSNNCTTKTLEAIDAIVPRATLTSLTKQNGTFRYYLKQHLKNKPWTTFGIDLILGAPTDTVPQGNSAYFLPELLMKGLTNSKSDTGTLSTTPSIVKYHGVSLNFEKERAQRTSPALNYPLFLFLLLPLIELWLWKSNSNHRSVHTYDTLINVILALLSMVMLFMWFFTDHDATQYNWNILWASPLFILLIFKRYRSSKIILSIICLGAVLALINSLYQWLPQSFNLAIMPITLMIFIRMMRYYDTPQS